MTAHILSAIGARSKRASQDAIGASPNRKGWCPGALRPLLSGDGYLVRLRPSCGALTGALARAIADCAARFGDGRIEFTQRANLQLRGVGPQALGPLQARLAELRLLDADAAGEAVRNVIVSPLAGVDPGAAFDVRPMAAALEARLSDDARLHALPAKFGFVVEDGGMFDVSSIRADVRFRARDDGFEIWLDGADQPFGSCDAAAVPDAATALALAFLRLADGEDRRMRELVARSGAAALREALDLPERIIAPPARRALRAAFSRAAMPGGHLASLIGGHDVFAGVAAAFGRCDAGQFALLAQAAGPYGLRLTPWRVVLAPGLPAHALPALAAAGWIVRADDPRLNVVACPGAPACASATTTVLADAAGLAALAPPGLLHVSGCAKGCAHPGPARFTLVGRAGRYDLVEHGAAGAPPTLRDLAGADLPAALAARKNAALEGAGA